MHEKEFCVKLVIYKDYSTSFHLKTLLLGHFYLTFKLLELLKLHKLDLLLLKIN